MCGCCLGGINFMLLERFFLIFEMFKMFLVDGYCKIFDVFVDGYVWVEVGMMYILLWRYMLVLNLIIFYGSVVN